VTFKVLHLLQAFSNAAAEKIFQSSVNSATNFTELKIQTGADRRAFPLRGLCVYIGEK